MIAKIHNYILESIKELKKVNWMSLSETWKLTMEVILFAVVFAVIYGIADFVFLKIIFIK